MGEVAGGGPGGGGGGPGGGQAPAAIIDADEISDADGDPLPDFDAAAELLDIVTDDLLEALELE